MDFLTCLTIQNNDSMDGDVVIINSTSLKKRALEFIKSGNYKEVYTYFDNDKAGEKALQLFKAELPKATVIPCNHLYEGYKDYNSSWQELIKEKNKNILNR
jgi:5S rRNA maturation endonuclease (ribonuclease M5)